MTDTQIRQQSAQPTVAVRLQQPMAELDLGHLFGQYLPNLAEGVAGRGGQPTGAQCGRYHA